MKRSYSTGVLAALAFSSVATLPLLAQRHPATPPAAHLRILDHGLPAFTASPLTLELTGEPATSAQSLAYVPVVWETSDPMRAWISQSGTVVFLHAGRVTVTARSGEASVSKTFDVRENPVASVALTAPAHVGAGEPVRLAATVLDRDGHAVNGAHVNFGIVQPGASVDDRGIFLGAEPGSYTVLAEANGAASSRTIVVDAAAPAQQGSPAAQRVELSAPRFTAYVGTTIPLIATTWAAAGGDVLHGASVQWSVDRSDVASVSTNGALTALAPGEVTITARAGTATARRKIRIYPNPTARVTISAYSHAVAPGDTVRVDVSAIAPGARAIRDAHVAFGVSEPGSRDGVHASITSDGRFVASRPGVYTVFAAVGNKADQETVLVGQR